MTTSENIGSIKSTVSSYLWEIKNFCTACKNPGDCLLSPVFSTVYASAEHKWRLQMYPKGTKEEYKDYLSLFFKYVGQSNATVNVKLSLLDDKNCKVNEHKLEKLFEAKSTTGNGWGFPKFEKQSFVTDKTNQVLVNDTINILCEIIHDSNLAVPKKSTHVVDNLPDYYRLKEFDEFEKLLDAGNSTDVTIMIGKDEIKVHKAIIMGRSPVFHAMFEHDMKERDQNIVEITDIKYEVMKEVFRFIYAGKVNEVEKIASDLLFAAEKYSLNGLKVLSERQLFKNLTVANAIEYLKLADTCNANTLKCEIIKFIACNKKHILHTPEFQQLPITIECEVLRAIAGINLIK